MKSLQCARAFAALIVVYFHSILQLKNLNEPDNGVVDNILPFFGKSGVDIFFVLSGLLIWSSTFSRVESPYFFYIKRVVRIVPLYWILTLTAATIALIYPDLLRSTRFELSHVIASLAFIPWPNPASKGGSQDLMTPVIVPGWTLNFEMFFYALFGLCLFARLERRFIVCIIVFCGAAAVTALLHNADGIINFYDPGLIMEFMLGLVLGLLLAKDFAIPGLLAWLSVILSTSAIIFFDALNIDLHRLFTAGIPAFVMIFALASLDVRKLWPSQPWLEAIGDATYSIYLTHIFVLAALRIGVEGSKVSLTSWPSQFIFVGLCLSCSVAAGLLTFRFVEQPIGRRLRRIHVLKAAPHSQMTLAGNNSRR